MISGGTAARSAPLKDTALLGDDSNVLVGIDSEDRSLHINSSDGQKICLFADMPPNWSAKSSDTNGLFLYSTHPTKASTFDTPLGKLSTCRRLLACARVTRYWMGPAFGSNAKDVPLDTQFLLLEVKEGIYALLLPLLDGDFRASLCGNHQNELICHEDSGDESVLTSGTRALYLAVENDPYKLLKESFAAVAKETSTFATLDSKALPPNVDEFGWCTWDAFYSDVTPQGVIDGVTSLREAGIQPKTVILDDGWQQVKPQKKNTAAASAADESKSRSSIPNRIANGVLRIFATVVSAMYETFVRKAPHNSIPNRIWRFLTRTVLKGQLWDYFDTETDFGRQLSGFQPNEKFRQSTDGSTIGLKQLATRLKTDLGVARLFCWHALHGYWRGVTAKLGHENGFNATNVMPQLSEHLLKVEPILAWDSVSLFGVGLVTDERDLSKFYDNIHSPLVDAGVEGVKVDVQSGVSSLGGGVGGGSRIARVYTQALEDSVSARFTSQDGGISCINCMCHSTENLYRYKQTSIARASDDFYPRRPNSHTVHLVNVAYNSLFIGEICLPDWDMFQSKHVSGGLHAAARAVSGGPVYVSDAPGEHDAELLKRLVLKDGSVLRCLLPGRPTRDCLFADVGKDASSILKVWNQNHHGGVVGLFNCQGVSWNYKKHDNEVVNKSPPTLTASVRAYDVESLRELNSPFVAFRHRDSALEYLTDGNSTIQSTLSPRDWDVITIVPVQTVKGGVAWAPIGLADVLNTGGAVSNVTKIEDGNAPAASAMLTSRGPGRFVAYCQPEPTQTSLIDNPDAATNLPFTYDARSGLLSFVLPSERDDTPHRVKIAWERG